MQFRTQALLVLLPVLAICIGCSKENDHTGEVGEYQVAYISIRLHTPNTPRTRSSTEETASNAENAIKNLFVVAFDQSNSITTYSTDAAAQKLEGFVNDGAATEQKPDAFRVPSSAKKLLLVANPGPKLEAVLTTAVKGQSFNSINSAITADASEIVNATNGYTMINCGQMVDTDTDAQDMSTLCLVDISSNIKIVGKETGQYSTDTDAKAAAEEEANRVTINIERLTAKVIVESNIVDETISTDVKPENQAIFKFEGWTLDAVNNTYYPWAKRVKTSIFVAPDPYYSNNFYTIDPNYDDNTGIIYNSLSNYAQNINFHQKGAAVYCIENTMRAAEQKFLNATRVVIKGRYYPDETWKGTDWFSYAGEMFQNFDALKTAYGVAQNVNLRIACDRFWTKIEAYANDNGIDLDGANNFTSLQQSVLDQIINGGEVVKDLETPGIHWFQQGLCYYWYEIRHDDAITGDMAFGKYGIVRNNVYNLTLTSVSKAGSPWYPSVDPGEGEKDPDPNDPIDIQEGYVGITIKIAPWVKWSHNIDV